MFLTGLVLAVASGLHLLGQPAGDQLAPAQRLSGVATGDRPADAAAPNECVRDPVQLPPLPPGPGGRPANYLHTCGNRLYDSHGREAKITGLSWNGMETGDYVPGGLANRKWQEVLDQVASLGYNTIRLPFSNEALEPGRQVKNVDSTLNPDLRDRSPLEVLDLLIAGARERGLKVILDRHQPTPSSYTGLWYTREVPEERWIEDWRMLAARYAGNDTVIGVDLSNEPRGEATWGSGDPTTDWRLAAERAGNAVLEVNPYLLIFVEGVENHNGSHYWWGGNLRGVRTDPVRLQVPNRVVYSPHDYGPNISYQPWFGDPLFPGNLPQEWDRYWGYIHREGIAPVVLGEFGGRSVGDDREGQWQKVLLAYLREHDIGALIWSLNPNWDTGGILASDWSTVETGKQQVYREILGAPLDTGALGVFGAAPTRYKVLFRQESPADSTESIAFSFSIVNDGPGELDLSRCELRYWLNAGDEVTPMPQPSIEAGEPLGGRVLVDLEPAQQGGQDHYLRIRFAPAAGSVDRYGRSGKVTVRISTSAWSNHDQVADYSYAASSGPPERLEEWDRVTLYLDGKLVWGREP